jgi:predicted TIM-barrel fold metal-dependent hydrolase
MLSSDSHIVEPPTLFTERMPIALRDRAPSVQREEDGDFWYLEGERICSFTGGIQVGVRFDEPDSLRDAGRFDEVRPGSYLPDAHLKENEEDGVFGAVINPSAALVFFSCPDSELFGALCRAYNDWLIDFCSYDPKRLKGAAMISLDDIALAIAELERCKRSGLGGALIPVYPDPERPYFLDEYEPFWAAAQDLEMPLGLHIGTVRTPVTNRGEFRAMPASTMVTLDYFVRRSLADIIFSGVFERFPKLHVGSIEHELGWAPYFVTQMDYTYEQRPKRPGWKKFDDPDLRPSDFFRSNVFLSFQDDMLGLRERETLGVSGLMWGSDYPHTETTFPRSQAIVAAQLDAAHVGADEAQQIMYGNVKALYGFED